MLPIPFSVSWTEAIVVAVVFFIVERIANYYRMRREVSFIPGLTFPASPLSMVGSLLPPSKYNPGMGFPFPFKEALYEKSNMEAATVTGFLTGKPVLYTSAPEVIKQFLANKAPWQKIKQFVEGVAPFGPNVFSTYNEDWHRQRKAVAPGFAGRLYPSVWNETIETYYDCMATEKWEKEREFIMPDVTAVTSKFALYLIAKCGFGIPLSWKDGADERVRGLTLGQCFEITSSNVATLCFVPRWMYRLPVPFLRRLDDASYGLQVMLQDIIDKRRAEGFSQEDQPRDIFGLLLAANELEKRSKGALSDAELFSNVFLFMMAGHETTSKALAATLGELASHPGAQERAYEEIMSVVKDNRDPSYDDWDRLAYLRGCFQEGIRLFPTAMVIMREATEDTVLQVPSKTGGTVPVHLRKGQYIAGDNAGMSFNPRLYPEPYAFKPERWLDPETEPLMTFSWGPRICIGKRFATTESAALLALLLRDFRIEPLLKEGQTLEQWHAHFAVDVEDAIGFGPKRFPLKFIRR